MEIYYKLRYKLPAKIWGKLRFETKKRTHNKKLINFFDKQEIDTKMSYIQTRYKPIIDKYAAHEITYETSPIKSPYMWICWWQGYEKAPAIVKACIDSIYKNHSNKTVILISLKNVDTYFEMPEFLKEKYKKGIIGQAHYSDILRMGLLRKYGGVWVDATIFTLQPLPEEFFTYPFFSLKQETGMYKKFNISILFEYLDSRWTSFLFSSERNGLFVTYMLDFYLAYWAQEDEIIDYLMIDYLFIFLYKKNKYFKTYIDQMGKYVTNLSHLNQVLNLDCQSAKAKLSSDEIKIYKTSYRNTFSEVTEVDKETYYKKLTD